MPPQQTGIADYSVALLPYLAEEWGQIEVFTEGAATGVKPDVGVYALDCLPERWSEYDFTIYHIGNNALFHKAIYRLSLRYPGITVLHDFFLHHLVAGLTITNRHEDFPAYLREMAYARGTVGVEWAYRAARDWSEMPLFEWPLNGRLLDVSLGTLVHSRFALREILKRRPDLRAAYVPAPVGLEEPPPLSRAELGWPEDAFILIIAGMPNVAKQLGLVLRSVELLLDTYPRLYCAFVGNLNIELPSVAQSPVGGRVLRVGYVPDLARFLAFMKASDVVVNLRYPTVGEASALTLRALWLGKPVIISDGGWYADLPDEVSLKLTHTGNEGADAEQLAELIRRLLDAPALRARMGEAGRAYVVREHHPRRVAAAYGRLLRSWRKVIYGS
jgi:glycosyltransferase involved in cell wall biosynthesis